ncbi:hypothetical protein [Metabacillus fastidiosus]|uniref:Uncharacterized protein n=1 Tax=Metabacillus fastidiosus TaxID=1458 RepID=A0ABU6P444_9BACI|nr:hypothetical protein [Metabacillus fastidiosus]
MLHIRGKKYIILHRYESGYCEIKEVGNDYSVELVHKSELENSYFEKKDL